MRYVLIILSVLLAGAARAAITVSTHEPGNVFVQGQRVLAQVAGGAGQSLTASLTPYGGVAKPCSPPEADGALDLGVLPQGYYALEVRGGADAARVPIAVVPKPRKTRAGRVATDAAHAWLIPRERFADGAELLRRSGVTWVRERFTWGEVEPKRGQFAWGRYDAVATDEARRGLNVYQVFHTSAPWSRKDGATNRFPDDLRDAYRFCKAAAEHYKGRVRAWEVWNEADISGFTPETAADYAAFLKAAYLGFHAGDRAIQVTQVSFALPAQDFADLLYRNGTPAYFDIFNYHIYAAVAAYPARAQGHFDALDRYAAPRTAVWLTEAGIPLRAVNNTLTEDDRRRQAEFLPKSFATSLASGTDRHFFFVFPHYLENGIEFGLLDGAMLPYPGYSALAATTSLLGEARYTGTVALGGTGTHALAFDNGAGTTVLAWRDGEAAAVEMPAALRAARVFNCVGAEQRAAVSSDGTLTLGQSPVFLVLKSGAVVPVAGGPLATRKKVAARRAPAPTVVLRLRLPADTAVKGRELNELAAGKPVPVMLQVYNFGTASAAGTVDVTAPGGWSLEPRQVRVNVGAMGLSETAMTLTPAGTSLNRRELRAAFRPAKAASAGAAPCVVDVAVSAETVEPVSRQAIRPAVPDWGLAASSNGKVTAADEDGGVAFDITFQGAGDRWAYPFLRFAPPADWREFAAIAMEIRCDRDDQDTLVRMQLAEPGGAAYLTDTGWPASTAWRRVVVPFQRLGYGPFSAPDANGRLDLDQIEQLRVGINTQRDRVRLQVRGVELLKLPR